MTNNTNKPWQDILMDRKHNQKANKLFIKLLAKQKLTADPFNRALEKTYPIDYSKPGGVTYDTI